MKLCDQCFVGTKDVDAVEVRIGDKESLPLCADLCGACRKKLEEAVIAALRTVHADDALFNSLTPNQTAKVKAWGISLLRKQMGEVTP